MPKSPKPPRRPAVRSRASVPPQPFAPVETRARHDGWTRERQTGFLQALAESGCVEEACAAVDMSRQSAYRLRARVDAQGFRMAWDKALDYAIRRLSDACFSRALHGEARPIFYKGEQVGERRHYDNKLAMFMMRYRDPLRYAATLDQMVYAGHTEGAAIGLAKAIDRVDAEADGLWEPGDEAPEESPSAGLYTVEPIATAAAKAREEAIIAGNAPIYGDDARRRRFKALREARSLEESGYKSHEERERAQQAERDAQREAMAADLHAVLHGGARRRDSDADVPSPLSPSAATDGPVAAPAASPPSASPPGGGPRAAKPARAAPSIRSTG